VLNDGTALRDLIDFDKREVSMRVLSDPEIYRLELRRIFARSWVGVGHEAEIPNPGDFVLRHIGEDAVIVTRTADGGVSILLNVCAHRGMEVCWSDAGNQSQFKCPYHGWVFDGTGKLLGAPFEQEMYGDWDKSEYGLRHARVGIHRGRIFGNFDADAEPFEEYIGDAAWYMDRCFRGEDHEMSVLQPVRRFRVKANWKVTADNNSGDTYHGTALHHSLSELGLVPDTMAETIKVTTKSGPSVIGFNFGPTLEPNAPDADPSDPYGLDRMIYTCMMFPSTFGVGAGTNMRMPGPSGDVIMVSIGGIVPRGAGEFEYWTGAMIDASAPESMRALIRGNRLSDLGGIDDMEGWSTVQRASRGTLGSEQTMKYNAVAGPSRPDDWPGPGTVYTRHKAIRDDSQWDFWLRWLDLMTADHA
jgi:nitrite reductase/ring-hydroxylating ferredoxin subunit